jgi:hypothetical protein
VIVPVTVDSERPGGRFPLDDQTHAPLHPIAVKVCEYAELIVQSGSVAGLMVIAPALLGMPLMLLIAPSPSTTSIFSSDIVASCSGVGACA